MPLSTPEELYEALRLLKEDERKQQVALVRKFKNRGVNKQAEELEEDEEKKDDKGGLFDDPAVSDEKGEDAGDEEEASDNEESGDNEEKPDEKGDDSKKDKKLAGAEELISSPQELPVSLKGSHFINKINKIRAGASLNDKKIQDKIIGYVKSLNQDERDDLYINLDSLARIILGNLDPAQVKTPSFVTGPNKGLKQTGVVSKPDKDEKKEKSNKSTPGADVPIVSLVVKEGVKKTMVEVPYILRSNRTVPFGHPSHIKDLEKLLSDLLRFKTCQQKGSDTYMITTGMIRTIKSQLAAAMRRANLNSPMVGDQEEVMPSLVEKD